MTRLVTDPILEQSSVVANNAMNRLRGLSGYRKDLGFDPLVLVGAGGSWLDLCCGSGRALVQAASHELRIVGVDLVDYFDSAEDVPVSLVTSSVLSWVPDQTFDLITCVHGLHYIGDKLLLLSRVVSWLAPGGVFAGHLDLSNVKVSGVAASAKMLRSQGFEYDTRRRLVKFSGSGSVDFGLSYCGADDKAGPNYTGQAAVNSHYVVA